MSAEACTPMAGGTDLLVQLTGAVVPPPARVIDLWRLAELRGIGAQRETLSIGALTTYRELRASPLVRDLVPALAEAAATIGAAQIQNRGTIGGNAINASPAGDMLPLLLATDAELVLGSTRGERRVAATAFWPAYRRTARDPDELLLRIEIPLPVGRQVRYRKVGTRRAQAISKVVMAIAWRTAERSPSSAMAPWREVRIALGSVAATPLRVAAAETALEGAVPDEPTADRVAGVLAAEISPIDDVRSTAEYRRAVAARVLHRLIRDEGGW